ncbi:MAG: hydrogen gas-evolving membrane-bound hydrogenase subunit E [Bacteroidia bacterium]
MTLAVLLAFIVAIFIPVITRLFRQKTGYILALLPLGIFVWFLQQNLERSGQTPLREAISWNEYFNLELAFYLDGLSLLFAMIISGIGVLIFAYAAHTMRDHRYYIRFFIFLTAFLGSMLGLVLADNVLTLVVFWELTSITSFLLIGFDHEKESARKAALQGLLVTALGGLALLAGLVLLGGETGTYTISELLQWEGDLTASPVYAAIVICVLLGAFTKSAQIPFHFWLPNAMAAPTAVSAFLHSATMVKAGIFLIARFSQILEGDPLWNGTITVFGALTMLTGAAMAIGATDLKQILAYSTISALGIMTLSLGIGSEAAIAAALVYVIAHAFYKSALFMIAGIIEIKTGSRELQDQPEGLFRNMPVSFAVAAAAALSLAGIIPMFGFIAKEMLIESVLLARQYSMLLVAAVVITGALFTVIALILTHRTFFSKNKKGSNEAIKEITPWLFLPALLPALAGLVVGVFPGSVQTLVTQAASSISPGVDPLNISLWHGWNQALLLSIISLATGFIIYLIYHKSQKWGEERSFKYPRFTPSSIYNYSLVVLKEVAAWQTRILQREHLRYYIMVCFITFIVAMAYTFFSRAELRVNISDTNLYVFEVVLGVVMILALIFILAITHRIGSLLSLGIVGIIVSIIFLEYGAPDLAITWILIDALTITVFVLILHRMPKREVRKSRISIARDTAISVAAGAMITAILFSLTNDPLHSKLKEFYAANSLTEAHGRNIVNVILVDFRALDTFGEITVLAISALGVYTLIRLSMNRKKEKA